MDELKFHVADKGLRKCFCFKHRIKFMQLFALFRHFHVIAKITRCMYIFLKSMIWKRKILRRPNVCLMYRIVGIRSIYILVVNVMTRRIWRIVKMPPCVSSKNVRMISGTDDVNTMDKNLSLR